MEDTTKQEKKAQKRSSSPKNKPVFVKNPINITPTMKVLNPISVPPQPKKIKACLFYNNNGFVKIVAYMAQRVSLRIRTTRSTPCALLEHGLFQVAPSLIKLKSY